MSEDAARTTLPPLVKRSHTVNSAPLSDPVRRQEAIKREMTKVLYSANSNHPPEIQNLNAALVSAMDNLFFDWETRPTTGVSFITTDVETQLKKNIERGTFPKKPPPLPLHLLTAPPAAVITEKSNSQQDQDLFSMTAVEEDPTPALLSPRPPLSPRPTAVLSRPSFRFLANFDSSKIRKNIDKSLEEVTEMYRMASRGGALPDKQDPMASARGTMTARQRSSVFPELPTSRRLTLEQRMEQKFQEMLVDPMAQDELDRKCEMWERQARLQRGRTTDMVAANKQRSQSYHEDQAKRRSQIKQREEDLAKRAEERRQFLMTEHQQKAKLIEDSFDSRTPEEIRKQVVEDRLRMIGCQRALGMAVLSAVAGRFQHLATELTVRRDSRLKHWANCVLSRALVAFIGRVRRRRTKRAMAILIKHRKILLRGFLEQRRQRATDTLIKSLRRFALCSKFPRVVHSYIVSVITLQRSFRNFLTIRANRLQLLSLQWEECEFQTLFSNLFNARHSTKRAAGFPLSPANTPRSPRAVGRLMASGSLLSPTAGSENTEETPRDTNSLFARANDVHKAWMFYTQYQKTKPISLIPYDSVLPKQPLFNIYKVPLTIRMDILKRDLTLRRREYLKSTISIKDYEIANQVNETIAGALRVDVSHSALAERPWFRSMVPRARMAAFVKEGLEQTKQTYKSLQLHIFSQHVNVTESILDMESALETLQRQQDDICQTLWSSSIFTTQKQSEKNFLSRVKLKAILPEHVAIPPDENA